MDDSERRHGPRVPVQMWVEEVSADGVYFQHTANLSEGGLFLDRTIPHPVGTRVRLAFALPDGGAKVEVQAEIVSAHVDEATLGMGLRFLDLPQDVGERIRRFIATQAA